MRTGKEPGILARAGKKLARAEALVDRALLLFEQAQEDLGQVPLTRHKSDVPWHLRSARDTMRTLRTTAAQVSESYAHLPEK